MSRKILIVDDDPMVRDLLDVTLRVEGFEPICAPSGEEALRELERGPVDLIILDLRLTGMDGLTVCREIRRQHSTPLMFLSAKGETIDRIVGLEVGADDYLSKPFDPREVLARVRALLRRGSSATTPPPRVQRGALSIEVSSRRCWAGELEIPLTTLEFDLLRTLMESPTQVFTRQQLLDRVWGPEFSGEERTVDAHLSNLRRKVRDSSKEDPVTAIRGVGYRFALG